MSNVKKIGKRLLYPPAWLMLSLLPLSAALLLLCMLVTGTSSVASYVSYAVAAYTLTVWCVRIPDTVKAVKHFKRENKYMQRWFSDARLRVNVSLAATLTFNTAYAALQLMLGLYTSSLWYYSAAGYYFSLAVMRFFLFRHVRAHLAGEKMRGELKRYRACGCVFLLMNIALTVMLFIMVFSGRSFKHGMIITIAMAAYTFTALTVSIVNIFKYRKYNSPVYSAAKAISLASACVSMITLEATMLSTFGGAEMNVAEQRLMLAFSGAAVSAFVIFMALHMIYRSTKKLNQLKEEENKNAKQQ